MENSPNSMELQIDTFLEQFKRSASKAMDGDWGAAGSMTSSTGSICGATNLVKSKSRASCSNVADLSGGGREMMASQLAEQEAKEVLQSWLSINRIAGEGGGGANQQQQTVDAGSHRRASNGVQEEEDMDESEERQNETIDIETVEEHYQQDEPNDFHSKSIDQENYDSSDAEDDSPACVELRLKKGCECKYICFKDLDAEQVYKHRLNIAELTKDEHDMYLMGVTVASISNVKKTSRQKDRQRNRASYVYQGKRVCLEAFLFLENVTHYHIKRIRDHVLKHGVVPRTHGNIGKKPHNTFSLDMYKNLENYIKKFLRTYVTDFNKNQVIYGITRVEIYNSYKDHGRKDDEKLVGYSTFRRFMKKQFPHIKFQKVDHTGRHAEALPKISKKKQNFRERVHTKVMAVREVTATVVMEGLKP